MRQIPTRSFKNSNLCRVKLYTAWSDYAYSFLIKLKQSCSPSSPLRGVGRPNTQKKTIFYWKNRKIYYCQTEIPSQVRHRIALKNYGTDKIILTSYTFFIISFFCVWSPNPPRRRTRGTSSLKSSRKIDHFSKFWGEIIPLFTLHTPINETRIISKFRCDKLILLLIFRFVADSWLGQQRHQHHRPHQQTQR